MRARTVAVVGAVVAVGATTMMGLTAGLASAAPTQDGRCTDNVNVRAEPVADSRIVAICETGTEVTLGATRNGFVQLVDLGGWAVAQYVEADGASESGRSPGAPSTLPRAPRSEDGQRGNDRPERGRDAVTRPETTEPSRPRGSDPVEPTRSRPAPETGDRDSAGPASGDRDPLRANPARPGRDQAEPDSDPVGGLFG